VKKPFYPFLLAVFPILFLFAHNIHEVYAIELLLPILGVIVGTAVILFSLKLVVKSYMKSGVITTLSLVLFFSYGYIRDLIYSLGEFGQIGVNIFLMSFMVFLFATSIFLVFRCRGDFQVLTKFFNITAIVLIVMSSLSIGVYEIKTIGPRGEVSKNLEGSGRDIYYIIFDEYARASTFIEVFNYDNSDFIDFLTDRGFYVASKSRCNYPETRYSMSTCLNLEYFEEKPNMAELMEIYHNSKVSQFLKSKGYRYIYVGHTYWSKGIDRYAEILGTDPFFRTSNFANFLIRSTAVAPVLASLGDREHGALILSSLNTLASISNIKEPTFVLSHIMCPHPPYVFDRYGNALKLLFEDYTPEEQVVAYVEQTLFLNTRIEILVDEILSKTDDAIIIIQGDHGTRWEGGRKFDILNAYYLPDGGNDLLYDSITPVNTFRIVFNYYFDTDYDLLEDKCYELDLTPALPEK